MARLSGTVVGVLPQRVYAKAAMGKVRTARAREKLHAHGEGGWGGLGLTCHRNFSSMGAGVRYAAHLTRCTCRWFPKDLYGPCGVAEVGRVDGRPIAAAAVTLCWPGATVRDHTLDGERGSDRGATCVYAPAQGLGGDLDVPDRRVQTRFGVRTIVSGPRVLCDSVDGLFWGAWVHARRRDEWCWAARRWGTGAARRTRIVGPGGGGTAETDDGGDWVCVEPWDATRRGPDRLRGWLFDVAADLQWVSLLRPLPMRVCRRRVPVGGAC